MSRPIVGELEKKVEAIVVQEKPFIKRYKDTQASIAIISAKVYGYLCSGKSSDSSDSGKKNSSGKNYSGKCEWDLSKKEKLKKLYRLSFKLNAL